MADQIRDWALLRLSTAAPTLTITENAATLPAPLASTTLYVAGADGVTTNFEIDCFGTGTAAKIVGRAATGTAGSLAATENNQSLLNIGGAGRGTTAYATNTRAQMRFVAAEAWTDAAQGTYINFWTNPIGSASGTADRARIDDVGRIYTALGTATATAAQVGAAVFTQTADSTTTANSLTTLFGTGVGSLTLPANLLIIGRTIEIEMGGYISAADGGAGTKTLTLALGGVTVATATSGATFTTVVNNGWSAKAFITCRTIGGGGTVIGGAEWGTQIATANEVGVKAVATATAACATTGTLAVNLSFNNGNATGTIRTTYARVNISN